MKLLNLILVALLLNAGVAFAQERFVALEQKFAQQPGFSASFTQTNYNQFKNKTTLLKGTVKWLRPGLARFEYTSPDPLLLVLGQEKVWIFDPLLENVTVEPRESVQRVEALAFLFGSQKLRSLFTPIWKPTYHSKNQGAGWVYLKPKTPTPGLAELHLLPGGSLISGFLMFDGEGNWRRFDLEENASNKPPVTTDFIFHIPEGMEVIDKLRVAH